MFTIINDPDATTMQLYEDLDKIQKWAFQWKMGFNPKTFKQAQEVTFTCKIKKVEYQPIFFNDKPINKFDHKNIQVLY